jgi:MFS-type transporter involved in bile tolerance (Atg22 family)
VLPTVLALLVVLILGPMVPRWLRRVVVLAVFTLLGAAFAAVVFSISDDKDRLANSLTLIPTGVVAGLLVRLPAVHQNPAVT